MFTYVVHACVSAVVFVCKYVTMLYAVITTIHCAKGYFLVEGCSSRAPVALAGFRSFGCGFRIGDSGLHLPQLHRYSRLVGRLDRSIAHTL